MYITKTDKVLFASLFLFIFLLLYALIYVEKSIKEKGLKSIVEDIWYGENKQ